MLTESLDKISIKRKNCATETLIPFHV